MKIERINKEPETIESFAERYDLTMVITKYVGGRVTAYFKDAEIKIGSCLRSVYGDSCNELVAISHYARQISLQLLVIGAYTENRREIRVPDLK